MVGRLQPPLAILLGQHGQNHVTVKEGYADLPRFWLRVGVDHEDVAAVDAALSQAFTLDPDGVSLRAP